MHLFCSCAFSEYWYMLLTGLRVMIESDSVLDYILVFPYAPNNITTVMVYTKNVRMIVFLSAVLQVELLALLLDVHVHCEHPAAQCVNCTNVRYLH